MIFWGMQNSCYKIIKFQFCKGWHGVCRSQRRAYPCVRSHLEIVWDSSCVPKCLSPLVHKPWPHTVEIFLWWNLPVLVNAYSPKRAGGMVNSHWPMYESPSSVKEVGERQTTLSGHHSYLNSPLRQFKFFTLSASGIYIKSLMSWPAKQDRLKARGVYFILFFETYKPPITSTRFWTKSRSEKVSKPSKSNLDKVFCWATCIQCQMKPLCDLFQKHDCSRQFHETVIFPPEGRARPLFRKWYHPIYKWMWLHYTLRGAQ